MVVGNVVGHECPQMTDKRITSASWSTVSSIFLFLAILTLTNELQVVFITGGYD